MKLRIAPSSFILYPPFFVLDPPLRDLGKTAAGGDMGRERQDSFPSKTLASEAHRWWPEPLFFLSSLIEGGVPVASRESSILCLQATGLGGKGRVGEGGHVTEAVRHATVPARV